MSEGPVWLESVQGRGVGIETGEQCRPSSGTQSEPRGRSTPWQ